MKYLKLFENTGITSVIGIGCMRMASREKQDVDTIIRSSLENDINFFDHADIYGGGRSEELFGEVLKDDPTLRNKMFIQSKCGINKGMYDFSFVLDSGGYYSSLLVSVPMSEQFPCRLNSTGDYCSLFCGRCVE